MIRLNKRWLTLPEVEELLGSDPANRELIFAGCLAGEIESRIRTDYGSGSQKVEPLSWRNVEANWEESKIKWFPVTVGGKTLYNLDVVELDRRSIDSYFGCVQKEKRPGTGANPGGRPRIYDWEAFLIELAAHVCANGIPERQAGLEDHMMQWCIDTWGDQPSVSEVRKRVSKARRAIEARLKT